MKDPIERQEAIDAICKSECGIGFCGIPCPEVNVLKALPSAQPEHLTDDDFETIRIHLSAFKESLCNQRRWKEAEDYERLINRFMSFASAQSKTAQNISDLDLISRQAAKLKVAKVIWEDGDSCYDFHDKCVDCLDDVPSAQPERKHGYWIESHEHVYMCNEVKEWTNWYCSECDAPNSWPTDFCPYCGADLREDDHE